MDEANITAESLAVHDFQNKSCIESFLTVDEASITSGAPSLDNTLSNLHPDIISISDDQLADSSSRYGNSTTVKEIVMGIDQMDSSLTLFPSFEEQLNEYRSKQSYRMTDVQNNSKMICSNNPSSDSEHLNTTKKATPKPRNIGFNHFRPKRNYMLQAKTSHTDTLTYKRKNFRKICPQNRPPDWEDYLILVNKLTQKTQSR